MNPSISQHAIELIPSEVKEVSEKISSKGYQIYIVGGALRDLMMGKSVYDWDFTTNAKPEEILETFGEDAYHMGFGTVGIPTDNENLKPFEITTYRTESGYSDSRRPDNVEWGDSLEEDLKRRDFTINAMALRLASLAQGLPTEVELIDPYQGKEDLENKLIRAVGDANERFSEDALRMMRAIRIGAQLKFQIEEQTFEAIKNNVSLINKISGERVRDELFKIFASPNPYHGVKLLRESGLLKEILPEAEDMFGVEQKSPQRHHEYDVGTHALMALKNVKNGDPLVRFATFIHDIGKPKTRNVTENGVVTFYNHEVVGSRIANRISDRLRLSKNDKDKLWKLVRWHQFTVDEDQTDSAIRRFIRHVGVENIEDMLDLRTADRLGSGVPETSWRTEEFKQRLIEVQKQPFTVHDLKITGTDVMKELDMKPGPEVGDILKDLYDAVVRKEIPNEKEALLERLKGLIVNV